MSSLTEKYLDEMESLKLRLKREQAHRLHAENQRESTEFFLRKIRQKLEKSEMDSRVLAQKTAHDLRSPILTLSALSSKYADKLPVIDQRILASTLKRTQVICDEILKESGLSNREKPLARDAQESNIFNEIEELLEELTPLMSQKGIDLRLASVGTDFLGLISPGDLARIVSNLVQNSHDSIDDSCRDKIIEIFVTEDEKYITINISDSGCGIESKNIDQIGEYGKTFKDGGHGFGVWHAKTLLKSVGGGLKYTSMSGVGTKVTIQILKVKRDQNIVFEICPDSIIVVLDDDELIHLMFEAWLEGQQEFEGKLLSFYNLKDFEEFMLGTRKDSLKNALFIFDENIGEKEQVGSRSIVKYGLESKAIIYSGNESFEIPNFNVHGIKCVQKNVSVDKFLKIKNF